MGSMHGQSPCTPTNDMIDRLCTIVVATMVLHSSWLGGYDVQACFVLWYESHQRLQPLARLKPSRLRLKHPYLVRWRGVLVC